MVGAILLLAAVYAAIGVAGYLAFGKPLIGTDVSVTAGTIVGVLVLIRFVFDYVGIPMLRLEVITCENGYRLLVDGATAKSPLLTGVRVSTDGGKTSTDVSDELRWYTAPEREGESTAVKLPLRIEREEMFFLSEDKVPNDTPRQSSTKQNENRQKVSFHFFDGRNLETKRTARRVVGENVPRGSLDTRDVAH